MFRGYGSHTGGSGSNRGNSKGWYGLPSRVGITLQPLQVGSQVGRVLVAQVPIFLQRLVDDSLQLHRHFAVQPHRRGRALVQDGVKNGCRSVALEGQQPGGHFVEHGAEGKQVGTPVELFAQRLLWRHVRHCSQGRSRTGQVLFVDRERELRVARGAFLARRARHLS